MDYEGKGSFWDRLQARIRPSGPVATVEEPRTLVRIATVWSIGPAINALVIGALFFSFAESESGWALAVLAVVYAASWFAFIATGSVRGAFALVVTATWVNNVVVMLAMGGYANSGAFLMWGLAATVASALLLPRRDTVFVGALYVVSAIVFGFLEQSLQSGRPPPDPALRAILFPYLLVTTLILIGPIVVFFLGQLVAERKRSESLLLNVLPESIARRLKQDPGVIADDFPECSVLFADIAGFTTHTREIPAHQLVEELNVIFSTFDNLADRLGAQKIKTIGDGYMAVAGVPDPRGDHLKVACDLASDIQHAMGELTEQLGSDLQVRVGVSTGPAVAGVIGTTRFAYDLWGDTVNIASRMESHGRPGQIQVSESVYQRGQDLYDFEPLGTVDVKGIGPMNTFLLTGRAKATPTETTS